MTKLNRYMLLILLACAHQVSAADLEISEAWIKNLPPVVPMRAGYMNITNTTNQVVIIESLQSESFDSIEIHRSTEVDGVVSMQAVESLSINSGESVSLEPGGYHLMMMMPADDVIPGFQAAVTFHYRNQESQTIHMLVKK